MVQVSNGFNVLGLLALAAVGLLVLGVLVVVIVLIATSGKNKTVVPEGDSGIMGDQRSYFDGGFFGYIGMSILFCLISVFTLGIAVPWAICMVRRWEVKHTVISGRRLTFTGTGGQLFGKYILGVLLTIVTFGIYSIWFGLSIEKWAVSHTVYADAPDEKTSRFTGGAGGWFGYNLLMIVLPLVTFGIGLPFAIVMRAKWLAGNTVIGGSPLVFNGSGGRLFGKMLLWGLLSVVTFGIFDLFVYVKYLRWEKASTGALYRAKTFKDFAREQEKIALENFSAYSYAANNAEFDRLRSGMTDDKTPDEIKAMAENGNIYACYDYACMLIDKYGENNDEAIDMLRTAAYGGYHQAMIHYAYYVREYSEQEFVDLVKGAAKAGNFEAPCTLKDYYEGLAYDLKDNNDPGAVDALREAAYWFMVAINQGSYGNEDKVYEYEAMLDTIAFWKAATVEPKKGGAGVVVGAVLGILALLGVLGFAVVALISVFGVRIPVKNFGVVNNNIGIEETIPYEDIIDDDVNYGEIIGPDYSYISNVVGYSEAEAVRHIESMDCVCEVVYTETSHYTQGTVISCSHPEGEYIKGEIITIEVAVAPQYPELTRSRAFELVDGWNAATCFMAYYFGDKGMLDHSDTYPIPFPDETYMLECASVPSINTKDDLRDALSADFTYDFIDKELMVGRGVDPNFGVELHTGCWFEAKGKIYYMPNESVGFYDMDINTMSIEQIEPGKYKVKCNGGVPEPSDYGAPYEFTIVYDNDGYKIDSYYNPNY